MALVASSVTKVANDMTSTGGTWNKMLNNVGENVKKLGDAVTNNSKLPTNKLPTT